MTDTAREAAIERVRAYVAKFGDDLDIRNSGRFTSTPLLLGDLRLLLTDPPPTERGTLPRRHRAQVPDNTFCGASAEWHFKPGYDPQLILDALSAYSGEMKDG